MANSVAAGSAPDLKSPYVIKRKPPPSLSTTERYPAPDPSDPFAPLWVLRHRTSSALHGSSLPSEPSSPLDARQRSNSTFNRAAPLAPSGNAASFGSITTGQDSHYRLRSQSTALLPSTTNLVPLRSEHTFTPQRSTRPIDNKVHDSDTSGTESDVLVHQNRKPTSPSIRRRSSSTHHRFARLLRSRKSESIEVQGQGTGGAELARVRKGSISGPVVSTVVWSTGGQGFVSIHKNPVYRAAVPVRGNSVSLDTQATQPPFETSRPVSKDRPPVSILRRGHSHTPIFVSHDSSPLKKRRLSSIHLPLVNKGHDLSHSSNSQARNLRKSVSLAPDQIPRSGATEPTVLSPPPATVASEWELPTQSQLAYAASLPVISEKGKTILFGSIFSRMRTIVVFIRHFWCPNCQDYMTSLTSFARPEILQAQSEKGGEVQLVIISNGAHTFIKKYRRIFRLPFRVYTDPTLGVYSALGMGKINQVPATDSDNRRRKMSLDEANLHSTRRGNYVKHGTMSGIALVVMRALKVGIPLWEKGGDVAQLGGEFVLGPGLTCSYAHRMQSTRGHAPVEDVLNAAYGTTSTSAPFPSTVVAVPNGCDVEGRPCNSVGFPCAHRIRRRPEHIKMNRTNSIKNPDVSAPVAPRQSIDSSSRPPKHDLSLSEVSLKDQVTGSVDEKRPPKKLPRIPVQKVVQVEEKPMEVKPSEDIQEKQAKTAVQDAVKIEKNVVELKPSEELREEKTSRELPEVPQVGTQAAPNPDDQHGLVCVEVVDEQGPKQLPDVPIGDEDTCTIAESVIAHNGSICSIDTSSTEVTLKAEIHSSHEEDNVLQLVKVAEAPLPDLPVDAVDKHVAKAAKL